MTTTRRSLLLAPVFLCSAVTALFSIPVPHRVLLVVDTNFNESVEIADYYKTSRDIPEKNIVYVGLDERDRTNNYYSGGALPFGRFTNELVYPIFDAISDRQLDSIIDYIVLSYGIPVRMLRPGDTRHISTASYIATWGMSSNRSGWSLKDDYMAPGLREIDSAFSCTNTYHFYNKDHQYRLTSHLYGYNVADVKKGIDNAVSSDGQQYGATNGKWVVQVGPYSMLNSNNCVELTNDWTQMGLDAAWYPKYYDYKNNNITNVLVLLHGGAYSGYTAANYTNYLPPAMAIPGAYAEAHESFGCVPNNFFEDRGQAQFPEAVYFRLGFAGYSGAVAEPFLGFLQASSNPAYSERLRRMLMDGFTLYEAGFFVSWNKDRGPITFCGDPLTRPFARIPALAFNSPSNSATVAGTAGISISATAKPGYAVKAIELYVNDTLVAGTGGDTLDHALDTRPYENGACRLYAVAYEDSDLLTPAYCLISIQVSNIPPAIPGGLRITR